MACSCQLATSACKLQQVGVLAQGRIHALAPALSMRLCGLTLEEPGHMLHCLADRACRDVDGSLRARTLPAGGAGPCAPGPHPRGVHQHCRRAQRRSALASCMSGWCPLHLCLHAMLVVLALPEAARQSLVMTGSCIAHKHIQARASTCSTLHLLCRALLLCVSGSL